MKNLKFIFITVITFFALATVVFSSCKKCKPKCTDPSNPDCSNYDPCYGKKPNAGFKIRQTCWRDFDEKWQSQEFIDLVGFSDTMWGSSADLFANFDSIPGITYSWKFDGMSTVLHRKDLIDVNFQSFKNNRANWLPIWDSFFTKPLGVTLTVTSKPNSCTNNDTVFSQKRHITFVERPLNYGRYTGFFSTNPSKEVNIVMNQEWITIDKGDILYINFPYHENDTIKLKYGGGLQPGYHDNSSITANFNNAQKSNWHFLLSEPYDLALNGGMLGMQFEATMNGEKNRQDVKFTYQYQKNSSSPVENITFTGYQTHAYRAPFPF